MDKKSIIEVLKMAYDAGIISKDEYFKIGKTPIENIDLTMIENLKADAEKRL